MSRIAKKSDLVKSDLKNFSIGLTEAKSLKITKADLSGIEEIIPNKKYKVRSTKGNRKSKVVEGTLLEAIKIKNQLNELAIITNSNKDITQDKDIMFVDVISLFIDNLFVRENRDDIDLNTIFDYLIKIKNYIYEYFKDYKLSSITKTTIENYLDYLRDKNVYNTNKKISERTVYNSVKYLNAILNFAVSKGLIISNPYALVTNKPKPKRKKVELSYFKLDDAKYALKCIDKYADIRLKTFMNMIFSLGCRKEEACGLRWCDIDFTNKEVNFQYALTTSISKTFYKKYIEENIISNDKEFSRLRKKGLKTYNSYRTNILSDIAIKSLKQYYSFKIACGLSINSNDYVFTTYREGRNINYNEINLLDDNIPADPNHLSRQWKKFKEEYNIKDVDLHRIRHTVANILERNGVPKKDIAKMLGNTERVLEEFYTHVDIDELKQLRNKIDNDLFDQIEYVDLNIDFVVKILNNYPIEKLNEDDLKMLDYISKQYINTNNYLSIVQNLKDAILEQDSKLNYLIDDNIENLKIKIESYKRFKNNESIKLKKEKDISIIRDILSF